MKKRCQWPSDIEMDYHDTEWGVPVTNDKKWFEFLVLDSFQAGLSWKIILQKREGFRKAFYDFDVQKVAQMTDEDMARLREDSSIIRNRLKIKATVTNAQAFIRVQEEYASFNTYIWSFTNGKTIHNQYTNLSEIPASTPLSDKMSKDLKARGFKFVGSTICYAFMQASGIVNDHTIDCYRHQEIQKISFNK
ncbi:DNA-3-methyladenine glycosylase I [Flavobacteriales bacterium]|jgi:DNA-3-methyladenine glycosylase I|nr:DNA-3-methyladenine glycosylase I [Flavobacteriales bacterium]